MAQTTIFEYENPRQFVLDRIAEIQRSDTSVSIRGLSKKMGIGSHALLLMLLQGKRPLRVKHAGFLAKGLNLTSQERLYLQALIQFDSAEDPEEKKLCQLWLSDLNPGGEFRSQEVDEFILISHWVHMAILAMTELGNFSGTAEEISKRLRGKVGVNEVRAALERLTQLKLISRSKDGKLVPTFRNITTKDDVANIGAKKYHEGVLDLAKDAVEKLPLDKREFQSFSIAMKKDQIPLAKEMIRKFRSQFCKTFGTDAGDEVYQMNVQLFQLTESPERSEDEGVDTGPKQKGYHNA